MYELEVNGSVNDLKLLMNDREILPLTGPLDVTSVRGKPLLTLYPWNFSPLDGEWIYVRGNSGYFMDIERMDVKDKIFIWFYSRKMGGLFNIPFSLIPLLKRRLWNLISPIPRR